MNLFKGLMFLEGHFTRPDDLDDDFAPLGNRAAGERWNARPTPAGRVGSGLGLLQHLQFLGGRPMHAGHNLDLEEPFEQLAANDEPQLRACAACG